MCGSANLYNFASVTWVPMLNTTRGTEKPPGTIQLLRALNMLYLEWWETISNTFFLCTCSCKQESFTTGALGRSCCIDVLIWSIRLYLNVFFTHDGRLSQGINESCRSDTTAQELYCEIDKVLKLSDRSEIWQLQWRDACHVSDRSNNSKPTCHAFEIREIWW